MFPIPLTLVNKSLSLEVSQFQNCTYQITNRRARPAPKPEEQFDETLNLGDLRDICRIRMF